MMFTVKCSIVITLAESSSKLWKPVTIHWKHVDITRGQLCSKDLDSEIREIEPESWFDSQLLSLT